MAMLWLRDAVRIVKLVVGNELKQANQALSVEVDGALKRGANIAGYHELFYLWRQTDARYLPRGCSRHGRTYPARFVAVGSNLGKLAALTPRKASQRLSR